MSSCNVIVREEAPGKAEIAAVDPVASKLAVENRALAKTASAVGALRHNVIAKL